MAVDLQGVVTLLASVGGIGGLVAVLRVVPELKRLQSETRKIDAETDGAEVDVVGKVEALALSQMRAAAERADHAERDVARLRAELEQLREDAERDRRAHDRHRDDCSQRIDRLEAELQEYRRTAQEHVAWDYARVQEAQAAGVALPPPPPLLPAGQSPRPA